MKVISASPDVLVVSRLAVAPPGTAVTAVIVSRLGLYARARVTDVMVTVVLALLCRLSGMPLPETLFCTPLLMLGYWQILPSLSVLFCTSTACPGPRVKSGRLTVTEEVGLPTTNVVT